MLDGFIKASTKTEKRRWFIAQGITDVSFLQDISLPDGAERFELESARRRLPPLTTMQSTQPRTEPDLLDFYSRFFERWVSSEQFSAIAADFPTSAAVAAGAKQDVQPIPLHRVQLIAQLKLWRLHDHGSVADLAHRSRPLTTQELALVDALGRKANAYANYAAPTQAFFPLLARGPDVSPLLPLVIRQTTASAQGKPRAVAIAKFRHAPYDTIGAVAEKDHGAWRVVAIVSTIDH